MGVGRVFSFSFVSLIVLAALIPIIAANSMLSDSPLNSDNVSKIEDALAGAINTSYDHSLTDCEELIGQQRSQIDIIGWCDIRPIRPIDPKDLAKIEEELRKQANLSASFERILMEEWSHLSENDRIKSTTSLEDLLRRQAILLESFQSHLKEIWCLLEPRQKQKFTFSYEDLLKRQSNLLLRFEDFLHLQQTVNQTTTVKYLSSFEDLIRREAILLDSLEDILKINCNKLKIDKSADKLCIKPGEAVNYTYVISNKDNSSIKNVTIIDDKIGLIAKAVELQPNDSMAFSKTVNLNGTCGSSIRNKAEVFGVDSKGFLVYGVSQELTIKIECGRTNIDSLTLGSQRAISLAIDSATATNSIEIIKNQRSGCYEDCNSLNRDKIRIGNQTSAAFNDGGMSSNHIKIESKSA